MAELPSSIDGALRSLQKSAQAWRDMEDKDRAAVARACRKQFANLPDDWVAANAQCLGINPSKPDSMNTIGFEPFLFTSTTCKRLDTIASALEGSLPTPKPERQLENAGIHVYNMGLVDGQAAPGCTYELWSADQPTGDGKPAQLGASVVLAAGNQNFLTTVDVIERAFGQKECVFLKLHPIRPFMAKVFAHIFKPLAECGAYAQCLDSDLEGAHGAFLVHPAVTHLHMTGSGASHDRIVAALKAAGREEVEFTSELGCVSPWIICPGEGNGGVWQEEELVHHARMLSGSFKTNCSMNCLSPRVLVLPKEEVWPQRARFLELLKGQLAESPMPPPYYPGAHTRYAAFEKEYPDAQKIHCPGPQGDADKLTESMFPGQDFSPLPSLILEAGTIGSASCRTYALQNEAFAPVLAVATVDSSGVADFPMAAAQAVNEHLAGTLSCAIVCPDPRNASLDAALNELNYGMVALNMPPMFSYSNPLGVWGGAPGSYSREKPQSGLDFVGNHAKVPNASKGVAASPFLNKALSGRGNLPLIVWDSLSVLVADKSCKLPRIFGILLSQGFGFFPRRLPMVPKSAM